MSLKLGAIRWYDANSGSYSSMGKLLEGMVTHFTSDTGRKAYRREKLKEMTQKCSESVSEYNSRFEEAKIDTYLREEEYLGIYLTGLTKELRNAVVGARTTSLQETMKAGTEIYAQMALLTKPRLTRQEPKANEISLNSVAPDRSLSPVHAPSRDRISVMEEQLLALQTAKTSETPIKKCGKCGLPGHKTENCGIRCFNCDGLGHRANECRKPRRKRQSDFKSPSFTKTSKSELFCNYCKRTGHTEMGCFSNPISLSFRGPKQERVAPVTGKETKGGN